MSNSSSHRARNRAVGVLVLPALLMACFRLVDVPVAFWVRDNLYAKPGWSKVTSELPDLLLLLVLSVTLSAALFYLVRSGKGIYDRATRLAKLLAWTAPCSYLVKWGAKSIFGRVNTRCWLQQPDLYGFHWFRRLPGCDGFPSGHMLVVVALFAALGRFYPGMRPLCLSAASLLGIALVATNYHFVSDVVAGAFVGVLLEAVLFRLLFPGPASLGE